MSVFLDNAWIRFSILLFDVKIAAVAEILRTELVHPYMSRVVCNKDSDSMLHGLGSDGAGIPRTPGPRCQLDPGRSPLS